MLTLQDIFMAIELIVRKMNNWNLFDQKHFYFVDFAGRMFSILCKLINAISLPFFDINVGEFKKYNN